MIRTAIHVLSAVAVALFVGGIVPLEDVSPARAAGPTKCQPGWSALVHLVVATAPGYPNACANTACWPVSWEATVYTPINTADPKFTVISAGLFRTMPSAQGAWQSLPVCSSKITAGPWHSP